MTTRAARILRALLALVCGALAACSSFDARWQAAENSAPTAGTTRWEGRWASAQHTVRGGEPEGGRLRAVLTELHRAPGSYLPPKPPAERGHPLRADFRAHWKTFASSYTLTLTPVPGSPTDFRGTHELPAIFGGTYRYTARIRGGQFTAHYDSSYDRGTFTLRRLPPGKDSSPANSRH